MFDFYERRKIRQLLYSWPSLIVLIALSVLLVPGVFEVYQQEKETRINKNQRLSHLEGLTVREEALQEEIDRLNTERGVEEEIRQKFEVAKEGERVIVIVDTPKATETEENSRNSGFFKKLFGFFFRN
ncbi:septum formation initiator family protein [Candidatus Kaiserbacteria bacterium]|nr:septum formation initiator family protein [Candidatus Kaiserbacteria bacterium]